MLKDKPVGNNIVLEEQRASSGTQERNKQANKKRERVYCLWKKGQAHWRTTKKS